MYSSTFDEEVTFLVKTIPARSVCQLTHTDLVDDTWTAERLAILYHWFTGLTLHMLHFSHGDMKCRIMLCLCTCSANMGRRIPLRSIREMTNDTCMNYMNMETFARMTSRCVALSRTELLKTKHAKAQIPDAANT